MPINEPNPYEVLDILPDASNAEINQAFAKAMKLRKYPPDVIAKARKSLLNPKERIIADYFRLIMPNNISDFQVQDFAQLETENDLKFLDEFDGLAEAIADIPGISEIERRIGATLINFFPNHD